MRLNILASSILSSVLVVSPILAQTAQAVPGPKSTWQGIVPMMLIMFAIIYFLMIRPEQKKQKDRQALISSVKKGDKVATIGGIMGTVQSIKDATVFVKIADNTIVEFTKAAISTVIRDENEKVAEKSDKAIEANKDSKEKKK
jgi:preprotein translocase subunit YajC